jgi:(p)ppGpp synthase/HD superfamily hydrolase
MERVLNTIRDFADRAHGAQTRKYTPERYIVHPVRVMELCKQYTSDVSVLAAALLHDVLEDTSVSREEIKNFLMGVMDLAQTNKTLKLVEELTDEYIKSKYPDFNRRARKAKEAERLQQTSADAQTIKYADIIDNSREIMTHDPAFGKVFIRECAFLLQHMNKGNHQLYALANETLKKELDEVKDKNRFVKNVPRSR